MVGFPLLARRPHLARWNAADTLDKYNDRVDKHFITATRYSELSSI